MDQELKAALNHLRVNFQEMQVSINANCDAGDSLERALERGLDEMIIRLGVYIDFTFSDEEIEQIRDDAYERATSTPTPDPSLLEWKNDFQRDARAFCNRHFIPTQTTNSLIRMANISGGRADGFLVEKPPYPTFIETVIQLLSGEIVVRNVGIVGKQKLLKGLMDQLVVFDG